MAYVSPDSPLPPNSLDPVSACQAKRNARAVQCLENAVATAYSASQQIAGPDSFRSMGTPVVIDVARSQNARAAASQPVVSVPPNVAAEMAAAPQMLPLNVPESEYGGCSRNIGSLAPVPIAPRKPTMPPMMPAPVQLPPAQAQAPKYSNLCWALRNAALDYSQFDPKEYMALQYACSQKGYTGSCFAPPLVSLWLDQQRRAGTLPHISVPQSVIDAIPQAPDLTGVGCQDSYKLAGMAAYRRKRGMGAAWGDAGSVPCSWAKGNGKGFNWSTLGWVALGVVGLYAVGRKGRR
jgi:hypothetical protein